MFAKVPVMEIAYCVQPHEMYKNAKKYDLQSIPIL